MPVQNATITANDYNTVQSRINTIMNTDYGQSLLSSQVAVGDVITDDQLDNLRTDITKAFAHQQGSNPTMPDVDAGDLILASHLNDYATTMTTVETNKFLIVCPHRNLNIRLAFLRVGLRVKDLTHFLTKTLIYAKVHP